METYSEYCVNHIVEKIHDYVGTSNYGADFCYTITEGMNADGTCTFSTEKAKDYLKEWWDDAAEYWNYEKDNFGEHCWNPFESPEAYMVCMVIEGCGYLLGQCETLQEVWNDKFELTEEMADKIIEEVKAIGEVCF